MKAKDRKRQDNDSPGKKKKQARKSQEIPATPAAGTNKRYNDLAAYSLLFLVFILALFLRSASFDRVFSGGSVIFPSFDVYYHLRLITYSVQNFPAFLWHDSYVDYPLGYDVGWMPFYDIVIAFIALLTGSPSQHTIETVAAIFPAVLGSITIFPVFFIGKELRDRNLGLLSAFLFAIMPAHITVSRVGLTDHHVAEVFLFAMILLMFILSLKQNKHQLFFAVLAGIFTGLLMFTWSAAPIYIAIFCIFFIIQHGVNLYRGQTSDNLILIGAVAALTSLLITIPLYIIHWLPFYQILSVVALFSFVILAGFLSNAILKKGLNWKIYPAAVFLFAFLALGIFTLFPEEFGLFKGAMVYLARENMAATITETQPFAADYFAFITTLYFSAPFGFTLFFAFIGLLYYVISEFSHRFAQEKMLFLVSSIIIMVLTFQQVRFSYLMSVFVAFFASYFIYRMIFDEKFVYNKKTTLSLILLILLIGVPTAYQAYAASSEPPEIAGAWLDTLTWMRNNSPATGSYDDPGGSPEYGIMAWADYGNWIEYVARRPVVANNFQQGISDAVRYFTADSEITANEILDRRRVRYVIVDDETGFGYRDLVYGKYGYLLDIAKKNRSDYYYTFDVPSPNSITMAGLLNKNYYNTIFARLYLLDGSSIDNPLNIRGEGLSHYRLVYESGTPGSGSINISKIKVFEYVRGATISGITSPDADIKLSIPIRTNTKRSFDYIINGRSGSNGSFTLVVPYATEGSSYETGPTGVYTLSINGAGVTNISVSDRQILDGASFDLGYLDNPGNRTGAVRLATDMPSKMDVMWKYDTEEKIYDVILKNDIIYATSDKHLFAIPVNGSSPLWKQETPTRPTTPEITEETLYSSIQYGSLTKIYVRNVANDKTSLINVPYNSASISPVMVNGNYLYMGTGDVMNSYDLSGNAIKWKFTADDAIISKPVSKDDTIYFASYNGTIYALDMKDGALRWEQDMKNRIWSSLVVENDTIYFGDRGGNINALDARTGGLLWKYETGYFVDSVPTFLNDTLFAVSYDGKVYALNAGNGELIWKSEQLFPMYASPVVERGSVYAGSLDGNLYRLNATNGIVMGICATNRNITAPPVARDGIVYVGSQDGGLYACKTS